MFKSFKSKISATFFLITVLIASFFFVTLYTRAVEEQTENLRTYLKHTAALGASFLPGDDILKIPLQEGCEKSLIRQALIQDLKKIAQTDSRIDDAYVMLPGSQEKIFHFVANANQELSPTACGEPYEVSEYPEIMNALKVPDADHKITKDKWGEWLSGYAPIRDFSGNVIGLLGLDVAAKTVRELQMAFLGRFILVLVIALILAILIGVLSSQWLSKPIEKITSGMERVSEGDLNYYLRNIPETEFNRIVVIFNQMTNSLKRLMSELAETVKERERVTRELEIAASLQQMALPEHPPDMEDLDIAAKSIPAKEVGGDYFDFLLNDSKKVGFVIADAAGKGFPGSLYMTNSRSVFRVISQQESVPSQALRKTNDFISTDSASSKGMFITFLYSVYDRAAKKLTYSNAGHYLPIIFEAKTKKFKPLHTGGLPMGIYPEQDYPEETVQLSSGDTVVMFTDGIVEAMNLKRDLFSLTRLMKIVEENSHESASELLKKIESEIKVFAGAEPQSDDITLIVFKVR